MGNALYLQVCDYIQSRIASGEYPVGSQIPTEHELATRLSVNAGPPFAKPWTNCPGKGI